MESSYHGSDVAQPRAVSGVHGYQDGGYGNALKTPNSASSSVQV